MTDEMYGTLADVYDWLVPDALLAPEQSVALLGDVVDGLKSGARVLDCAAGTGQLAVGLALRGFTVVASDASSAMIRRTRTLARDRGVELQAVTCTWSELEHQGWGQAFDAVFCVGNSLAHAAGRAGRRRALTAMGHVLREGGLLVASSRNWEQLRAERPALKVADRLIARAGRHALVIHAWTIPDAWDEQHHLDLAVAIIDTNGHVITRTERLPFWPFGHRALDQDMRAVGMVPTFSSYAPDAERYIVTARRAGRATADDPSPRA